MSILLPDVHVTPYTGFRVGIVADNVDPENLGRIRVTFADRDQTQSWWLYVAHSKAQADKSWALPDLGEQVLCLMDPHDEDGAVLGAVYSLIDTPPNGEQPSNLRISANPLIPGIVVSSTLGAMFESAAANCPALATCLPGVSGAGVLEGLAMSESSFNPNAQSPQCSDGSYCWGIMQISTSAHSGYTAAQLTGNVALNISIGEADLCGRITSNPTLAQLRTAIAGYKGFSGPDVSASSTAEVNEAIGYMHAYATA